MTLYIRLSLLFLIIPVLFGACQSTPEDSDASVIEEILKNKSEKLACDLVYEINPLTPNSKKLSLSVGYHCEEIPMSKSLFIYQLMKGLADKNVYYHQYYVSSEFGKSTGFTLKELEFVEAYEAFAMDCFKLIGEGRIDEIRKDTDRFYVTDDYFELIKENKLSDWKGSAEFYSFDIVHGSDKLFVLMDGKFNSAYCTLAIDTQTGKIINLQ